ncbi:MAG: AbrB/MazE/SpoVT family DNA-binding domain-containing protein [Candidatus Hodarchaeota archaeon]
MTEDESHPVIYGTAKVGARGQVVIPVQARTDRHIKPGDLMIVIAHHKEGPLIFARAEEMKEFVLKAMATLEDNKSR